MSSLLSHRFGHALRVAPSDARHLLLFSAHSDLRIRVVADPATFTSRHGNLPCAHWHGAREGWNLALPGSLPAPGVGFLPEPLITCDEAGMTIGYDILGLAFWMLTRHEELTPAETDRHGRFPASASHAFRHGYLERPIVDEWLHLLGAAMRRLWPGAPIRPPDFSMQVSHDVDWPSRYGFSSFGQFVRTMTSDLLYQRDFLQGLTAPLIWAGTHTRLRRGDPANTFEWLMDVSERHDLKSAFYFICGRTDAGMDAPYDPEHPAIRALMRRIHERGHEIGLHPSYHTYRDPETLVKEAQRLRRVCAEEGIVQHEWGGRMHILRWETPTTLHAWERARMSYDSTLGYADRPGFRCGTCHQYQAFDPLEDSALSLQIRPLIAMECTVVAPRYLGLGTGESARKKFLQLKLACQAVAGSFTLLWHNSELETAAKRRLYASLLE
ncbi:polysaccharide deacetylase family protein [Allopusillimonas soli]|nr:polysaccharide deacetylase family protein [Allopusillimonas soli]